jgi:hypothetical protein
VDGKLQEMYYKEFCFEFMCIPHSNVPQLSWGTLQICIRVFGSTMSCMGQEPMRIEQICGCIFRLVMNLGENGEMKWNPEICW